jgi:signal transduction histidine kinase
MPAILYIDDDRGNLTVFEAVCDEEFEVLTAQGGKEGLEMLMSHEIAVLVSDQRMPGMTGVDVLEAARSVAPDAVRILITAYSDLTEAVAAINRGAVERYIRKPWQPDELRMALRDAMALYNTRRKLQSLERRLIETERVYALGVVAAGVAHELRNPMTALVAMIDLAAANEQRVLDDILQGKAPPVIDFLRKNLQLLMEANQAADQVMEITRGMELGQRHRENRRVDVKEVVNLTLRILRSEFLKRAALQLELEPGTPEIIGSPHRLGQVFLNLVVNALQALPDDRASTNRVTIRVRTADDKVVIEVGDNGPGIPDPVLHRIFDPFFTTKEEGGTGLGLAISRTIVEELGGRIAVTTSPDRGTIFSVLLPAAPPVAPAVKAAAPKPPK